MTKLVCEHCGFEQPIPMHCGGEMKIRDNMLKCEGCGFETSIPMHCGLPMRPN